MTRPHLTPSQSVEHAMDGLTALVRNLLIDNDNFSSPDGRAQPHHFARTPTADAFVRGPLRSMAEAIIERAESAKSLAMDMAAPPSVDGLARSYTGIVRDREVTLVEEAHDRWHLTLAVPDAASADGDLEAVLPSEADALSVVGEFLRTGMPDRRLARLSVQGAA